MIDTHLHLCCFEENGKAIISSMQDDGLEFIVNIGTNIEDSKLGINLTEKNENVYTTVGFYPEFADDISDDDLKELENLANHNKVVAIGEIGLDYHNVGFNKEKQIDIFIKQLEIANKLNLPFCIHCRNAADDVFEVLSSHKHLINNSGVMHCYSEGKEYIEKFLSLGLYISFSGNITYKKSDRSFLKDIPLDRIVVETDAPYLSPEPKRGRKNEPKNVKFIIEKIAEEIGISADELEKITSQNAKKLYFKANRK